MKTLVNSKLLRLVSVLFILGLSACGGDGGGNPGGGDAGNDNDTNLACQPSAEVCDGQDNDCDDQIDEHDADDAQTFYADNDGDGVGSPTETVTACDIPAGYITTDGDCDDTNPDIHPGAAEICDNVDNNCDDQIDQGAITALDCTNQNGVCAGSTIAVCDGGSYATCGADEFGPSYIDDGGEDWRCDGLDNNCDGQTDEACCGDGSGIPIPTAAVVANGVDTLAPKIVAASSAAPGGAEYLVLWSDGQSLELQHVDATGSAIGNGQTVSVDADTVGEIEGIDIASSSRGYDLVWTTTRKSTDGDHYYADLWVQGFDAQLAPEGRREHYVDSHVDTNDSGSLSNPIRLSRPQIAAAGDERFVAWTDEFFALFAVGYGLRAIQYNANDRANPGSILDITTNRGEESVNTPLVPALTANDAAFAVAWANDGEQTLYGLTYTTDGTPSPTFEIQVDEDTGGDTIDVVWTGDDTLHVVYPRYNDTNPTLATSAVTVSSGQASGETVLTDAAESNARPVVQAVDTDADGSTDHLVVVWERGGTDPQIVAGSTAIDSPSLIDAPKTLRSAGTGARFPALAAGERALGSVWREGSSNNRVEFVPVSIDGVAICRSGL